jgi:hypothetical protein
MNDLPENIENWLVLYIAVMREVTIERAFILYNGYWRKKRRAAKTAAALNTDRPLSRFQIYKAKQKSLRQTEAAT